MRPARILSRHRFLALAALTGAGSALAACRPGTPTGGGDQAGKPGQAVVTAHGRQLPADAAPLDKQGFYDAAGEPKHLDVTRDIYGANVVLNWGTEPLLRRAENQNLVPALAESYKAGPNAEYFDFVLREGAKWSDGVPITPEDWVFTFRHLSSPRLDNPWTWFFYDIKGVKAHKEGKGRPEDIGVVKVDDRTIRIYGEGPAPHIPALLAYQAAVPAPRHKAEQNPEHWADTVEGFVGSGPFKPVKWLHNQRIEWEVNPYYNGPHKPGVQRVVQLMDASFNTWLNKEIDLMGGLQPAELAQVRADSKLKELLHSYNNFQTEYLALDTMNPPLNNVKLRQALSHAIDRDVLSQQVMNGTTVPAYSMLPPAFPAYNPALKAVQNYDVAKAKALLAEAGYRDGKDSSGRQLSLDLYSNARDVKLEFVKDQWERNLGISVNLQVLEGAVWGQRRAAHDMMIYKGPYEYDFIDPANLLTSLWRSVNEKGSPRHAWKNDRFDELVNTAGRETDEKKRMNLYQDAERLLVEDVGAVFLTHQVIFQVWWPYVTGIKPDKDGNVVFRGLDISRFQMYIKNNVDEFRKPH
jgi:ABC-type transport system substrate-binding protein